MLDKRWIAWYSILYWFCTRFGEFMRILRVKPHEVMSDAATLLGISTSLMSAVENGKKNATTEWFAVIAEHYTLTDEEQAELREVIENSKNTDKAEFVESVC